MNGSPKPRMFAISTSTVVVLVLLRLTIGWHFLKSGFEKFDPDFTSAPFLSQAIGPMAPLYLAFVPDYYGWDDMMAVSRADSPNPYDPILEKKGTKPWKSQEKQQEEHYRQSYEAWQTAVIQGWGQRRVDVQSHYGFTPKQEKAADKIFTVFEVRLKDYLYSKHTELAGYRHDLYRLENWEARSYSEEVPFEVDRVNAKKREIRSQANAILGEVKSTEQELVNELVALATGDQRQLGDLPVVATSLDLLDGVLKYVVLGIGVCLLLGLFSRLASFGGAAFLASLIMTIPPWEIQPAAIANLPFDPFYFWATELVALLVLMTTPVGRWGGLDWFVHNCFTKRNRGPEGE